MKAIFAVDSMGGIGYKNHLPWAFGQYKNDAIWFKNHTRGQTVVMGRKTMESLQPAPYKRLIVPPLKGRENIVITSKDFSSNVQQWAADTSMTCLPMAEFVKDRGHGKYWVIGGKTLIQSCLARGMIDQLYLTIIPNFHPADLMWPLEQLFENIEGAGMTCKSKIETDTGEQFYIFRKD